MGAAVERVVILNIDRTKPIYHRLGNVKWDAEEHRNVGWTSCGKAEPPWPWWTAHLRQTQARWFARPCSRCFPAAAR